MQIVVILEHIDVVLATAINVLKHICKLRH